MRAILILGWFLGTFLLFLLLTEIADGIYFRLVYSKMTPEKQEQVQYWLNHPEEYPRKVRILQKFDIEKEIKR